MKDSLWYLVTSGGYWGKGETKEAAKKAMKDAGGQLNKPKNWYMVHKDTTIDELGRFRYPKGITPPTLID